MTPNQIIAALLDLLHATEQMYLQYSAVDQDYITVRRIDFNAVREALDALPGGAQHRVNGYAGNRFAETRKALQSFLESNLVQSVDRPANIEATPPGMESMSDMQIKANKVATLITEFALMVSPRDVAVVLDHFNGDVKMASDHMLAYGSDAASALRAKATPASEIGREGMVAAWVRVKEKFSAAVVKTLITKFLSVTKLMDIPQAECALAAALAAELITMSPVEVDQLAQADQLDPWGWLQERKELRNPPPLEVKMARQVVENYYHNRPGIVVPACWFCSNSMPADRAGEFSTINEVHNEGCTVTLARQVLENYNAQEDF